MAVESAVTYDNIQFHKNTVQPDAMLLEQLIESSATTILMDYLTLPSREEKTPVTFEDFQKDIESVVHMLKEHHGDITIRILVSSLENPLVKQWISYCQKKGLGLFLRWMESPTMEARLAYHLGCDKTYGHSMEAFLKDMEKAQDEVCSSSEEGRNLPNDLRVSSCAKSQETSKSGKPKLLYASPLPPVRSGISEYSIQLVQALATQYDITLYTEQTDLAKEEICAGKYPVLYPGDPLFWDDYDVKMYHIGNNYDVHSYIYEAAMMHPGVVVLHDTNIYYLFQAYHGSRHNFYQKIYE
nr:hypothetical protein [Lachnospiraceae bacterium]